jgi:hypothetical protein
MGMDQEVDGRRSHIGHSAARSVHQLAGDELISVRRCVIREARWPVRCACAPDDDVRLSSITPQCVRTPDRNHSVQRLIREIFGSFDAHAGHQSLLIENEGISISILFYLQPAAVCLPPIITFFWLNFMLARGSTTATGSTARKRFR